MIVLADSGFTGWNIFQLIFSAAVSVAIWRLGQAQRKFDRQDEALHELATKLVDARFREMTHDIKGHMQGLLSTIDEMKGRLKDGDEEIDGLGERNQKIELAVAQKFDALKDWIREWSASKNDVEGMKVKIEDMGKKVAVLSDRISRSGVH